jgi:protein MpaA
MLLDPNNFKFFNLKLRRNLTLFFFTLILLLICGIEVALIDPRIAAQMRPGKLLTVEGAEVLATEAKSSPNPVKQEVYYSVKGRPIAVYIFGAVKPVTLVIGGIHGNETPGVWLARDFLKEMKFRSETLLDRQIILIPLANPDGFYAGTRVNAHKIDLNRNFPTKNFRKGYFPKNSNPGNKAASEPETKMILEVAAKYKPDLIITFHAQMGCVNYDGPAAEIAARISEIDGLPVKSSVGYPTNGSLGTYFGVEREIPVITFELLPQDNQWERHGKAILTVIGLIPPPEDNKSQPRNEGLTLVPEIP